MTSHWKIHELFNQFVNSGLGTPGEREAAYQLARIVPELMAQNAKLLERLRAHGELPKQKVA